MGSERLTRYRSQQQSVGARQSFVQKLLDALTRAENPERRELMEKFGKFAVYAAPFTVLLWLRRPMRLRVPPSGQSDPMD